MTKERELIERAQKGDHDAFLALLAQHDRQIMSVVFRFSGDLFDREDLYQEIFLHCFRSIKRYRFEALFRTWLYRLALNRCLRFMRKQRPMTELEEIPVSPPNGENRAMIRSIRQALSRLRGPQQISFHLYYIEDWSVERIAEVLGCSEGAVKSHLNRARVKIRADREVYQWRTT